MIERVVTELSLHDQCLVVQALRGYARLNTYHATREFKECREIADVMERALDEAIEANRLEALDNEPPKEAGTTNTGKGF